MTMEPGIYPNMSMADYLAIDAVNASALKHARRSMAHVRAALDGLLGSDTPSTDFGTLGHLLVLEPSTFEDRYVVDPGAEQFRTDKGEISTNYRSTKAFKQWAAAQAPKLIVSSDDLGRAKVFARAATEHPRAADMLGADGYNECVIVWRDERTGVLCKCRIDRLRTDWIVDLKSTRDAGFVFERQVSRLDYVLSGAFYRRGAASVDGVIRRVGLIAVESDVPHGVRAAPLDELQLDSADLRIDAYLEQVKNCQLSGVWPGYESPEMWRAADWVNDFDGAADTAVDQEGAGGW